MNEMKLFEKKIFIGFNKHLYFKVGFISKQYLSTHITIIKTELVHEFCMYTIDLTSNMPPPQKKKDSKNTQMFQQAGVINLCLQKIVFDLFIAPNTILGIFILVL